MVRPQRALIALRVYYRVRQVLRSPGAYRAARRGRCRTRLPTTSSRPPARPEHRWQRTTTVQRHRAVRAADGGLKCRIYICHNNSVVQPTPMCNVRSRLLLVDSSPVDDVPRRVRPARSRPVWPTRRLNRRCDATEKYSNRGAPFS